MREFDDKYGIDSSTNEVLSFHKRRIMFAIKDNEVFLGPEKSEDSHAIWFRDMGWIIKTNDELIETTPRGYFIDNELHCYVGYDFKITDDCEQVYLSNLSKLKESLNLQDDIEVYGGLFRDETGNFLPIKSYGKLKDLL